jgi:hypothetical protein
MKATRSSRHCIFIPAVAALVMSFGALAAPGGFARHLRSQPLRGVPQNPVVALFGKGDQLIPDPAESAFDPELHPVASSRTYLVHDDE